MFYIISLGPGDPDLITIKAIKALEKCDIIFVPVRSKILEWEGSVAYKILSRLEHNFQSKFQPIYTPMSYNPESWKDQVEQIASACITNKTVGFVTLGDAAVYSSAYYLLSIIKEKYNSIYENTEVIPGVTSISYASAKVKIPLCLGNSSLEIVPMHREDVKSTKVYMRLHKGDDVRSLKGEELYYFENLGMENEAYGEGTPGIIENYLTVIINFNEGQK
ncbi:MAG: hypothetical protein A2Y25_05070 [Candidatus Melainabacteria bacterium GWF2_37_15]|nr:MAG: hypothetical protein A2Y25_05070 [Candidatus Melainabacteria bacterium GWF2_37_15]